MADAPDLGSGVTRRVGSSPMSPTIKMFHCFWWKTHLAGIRLDEGAVLKTVAGKTVGGSSPSPVATSFLKYVLFFDFLKKL